MWLVWLILAVVSGILLVLFAIILFGPVTIRIDTEEGIFRAAFFGIVRARLVALESRYFVRVTLFRFTKDFQVWPYERKAAEEAEEKEVAEKTEEKEEKPEKARKKKREVPRELWKELVIKAPAHLRYFFRFLHVRQARGSISVSDPFANGIIAACVYGYPGFRGLDVNFMGENRFVFHAWFVSGEVLFRLVAPALRHPVRKIIQIKVFG